MAICTGIVMIILCPSESFSYDLYVHSIKASVYLMPDSGSQKLFTVAKGDKLTGLKQIGYWYKIVYSGKIGWIYRFMVRKTQPVQKQDIYGRFKSLFRKYEAFSARSRRRPSSYTAAAAARGLKEKRKRFAVKYHLDWDALEKIEAMDISDMEAITFLNKGISNEQNN